MSDVQTTITHCLFVLLVLASPLRAEPTAETAEPVTLRYQFSRGQYVHYEVESTSTMTVTARNTTQTLDRSRRTKKHYRVVTVDDQGSAVLEPVIDQVQMQARTDDNDPIVFDSRDPSNDVPKAFDSIGESVGKAQVRVRFSAYGRVEKVLGPAAEDMDQSKVAFLVALPDEPIQPGKGWDDDFTIRVTPDPVLGPKLKKQVTIRRKYTLDKVENGIAHISFRTYPLSIERNPHVQVQLVAQNLNGKIRFDLGRGILLESRSMSVGQVFNAFGPTSAMQSKTNSVERFVSPPARKKGPAGPALPGA